jgi:signal transduction histidine kinase/CheY-like chemotaxis protein
MTLIDLFFNAVVLYMLGSLLRVIPQQSQAYWSAAVLLYLVKTLIWLGLRIPLMLPIDRWENSGSPPFDNSPPLVRAVYYFPFDFTIFYGGLLGAFYAVLMGWMIFGGGPIRLGQELLVPGMMLAGSVCAGAIAIGVPVNLILTARLSKRLAERRVASFDEIPGKELSLRTKMATIALALGCAPSLLLFSVQSLRQDHSLYLEAERTAEAVISRLTVEPTGDFHRWALSSAIHPFWVEGDQVRFASGSPPSQCQAVLHQVMSGQNQSLAVSDRRSRCVVRLQPGPGGVRGVVVLVADAPNDWFALSLVVVLACFWPLLTATLLVRTIVVPVSLIGTTFHRIIGRGRTDGADRVPIFYKDEVGRLAHNANRTLDILTEARAELEVTAATLAAKNRELELAYRTKGEFLANMSHELRTPLNAIIGFSRLMKRKLKDTLPERQQKNLDLIEQSGEQLLALVNDLLDFERIEAGKLTIHRTHIELGPVLDGLAVTLLPQAEEKALGLEFSSDGLPPLLFSDKDRLRQILTNLITNAIRYSDRGTVQVHATRQGESVVFCVRDEGVGMSEAQLEKIFDPFHQVDGSHTRERGGVGLGLAIVARLVKLLRGEISVTSRLGEGSTFQVSLPLGDGLSALVPRGSGAEILVVDDNLEYLEAIYSELSEAGFRVTVAASGKQALEILAQHRPAVVLLDIMMPEMNGWEVLRRLRAQPELSQVPVVITSVVNERPVGLDVEFAGWLTKPFELEDFKRFLVTPDGVGLEDGLVIVEDDPQTAQLMVQVFEDMGLFASVFAGEQEAREHLARSLPSVLILDLNLQQGSGWSLLSYLRTLPHHSKTKVFIYTASDLSSGEREQLKESFVSVVHKHGRDSLSELVSSLMGGKGMVP